MNRLAGAQLGEHGLHVLDRAAHPLQLGVLEALLDERRAHLVVGEDRAVVALGGFVQLDGVVLDGGGLDLLGDALLHVARRLPDLEETLVRLVVNRVGVDARPGFRLGREDFLDGLTHLRLRPRDLIEQFVVVLGDLRLDEGNLVLGQPIPLVELGVCPLLIQRQVGDEGVDVFASRPGGLRSETRKRAKRVRR